MEYFIDCTSLSLSYDVMGRVTITYAIISDQPNPPRDTTLSMGTQTFTGFIVSINMKNIRNTSWYETHVTLIAVTD